jgi:hypothetical protein
VRGAELAPERMEEKNIASYLEVKGSERRVHSILLGHPAVLASEGRGRQSDIVVTWRYRTSLVPEVIVPTWRGFDHSDLNFAVIVVCKFNPEISCLTV